MSRWTAFNKIIYYLNCSKKIKYLYAKCKNLQVQGLSNEQQCTYNILEFFSLHIGTELQKYDLPLRLRSQNKRKKQRANRVLTYGLLYLKH